MVELKKEIIILTNGIDMYSLKLLADKEREYIARLEDLLIKKIEFI